MMKMQFNLFDGGARSARKSRAVSMVQREQETRDRVKRALINDLQLTWTAYKLLDSQIGAMRKSLYFTRRALESYKQEFKIGKRLLINILDAENEYQNARAQLAAIEYDLLSQKFRLLFSMGTIVEDLKLQAPFARELKAMKRPRTITRDRLPLLADRDRDGIDDQRDLSMNSLPGLPVDRLGETASASRGYFQDAVATGTMGGDTAQVRSKEELQVKRLQPNVSTRVDFVSFDKGSVEMSPESKVLMRELIAQVKPIAGDGLIQIMVTTNEFPGDADNYRLALQRAYNLKKILTLHDLDPEGIQVFAEQRAVSQTENSVSFRLATDLSGFREGFSTVSEPGLNFPAGEQTLTEAARNALSRLADQIRQQGNPPIDIVVYGNDFKDAARDEKLSAQRGEEIRKVLGEAGLPLEHAVVIPWGNFAPGDDLYRKAGDEESRNRVEIVIRR